MGAVYQAPPLCCCARDVASSAQVISKQSTSDTCVLTSSGGLRRVGEESEQSQRGEREGGAQEGKESEARRSLTPGEPE